MCHISHPFHNPWFDHLNDIWQVQIMMLLICSFLQSLVTSPLGPTWAPYSWKPSACVLPLMWKTKFHKLIAIKNQSQLQLELKKEANLSVQGKVLSSPDTTGQPELHYAVKSEISENGIQDICQGKTCLSDFWSFRNFCYIFRDTNKLNLLLQGKTCLLTMHRFGSLP
jgi:hypothetical protein